MCLAQSNNKIALIRMADQTYNSLSTNIISTATVNTSSINALSVSTGTLYARTLAGDGASLSNLNYANFNPPTIPRTSFGAYSVPWNAMEREGSLTIDSGTWLINGFLAVNSLSVATTFEASGITAKTMSNLNTYTASLTSPVICSFYISTQTVATDTVFFKNIYGNYALIDSTVTGFLSTGKIDATGFNVLEFYAQNAQFSSLSTGAWIVNDLVVKEINLFDLSSLVYSPLTLSANQLYLNNSSIFSNVVVAADLISTTNQLQFDLYNASNFLYPHYALSSLSTTVESNMSITQIALSSLCTFTTNTSNFFSNAFSNLSVNTFTTISNISTAQDVDISNLYTGVSSVGFIMATGISTSWYTLSTQAGSNQSTIILALSTVSSNLSTTIGQTSNYLWFFSSLSTMIMSSFSTLSLGLSSISTTLGLNEISMRTLDVSTGTLRAGMIMTSSIFISSLSTSYGFFDSFQGSTMSSLTQQIGFLLTNKITASSFSGNLGDAMTLLIQRI